MAKTEPIPAQGEGAQSCNGEHLRHLYQAGLAWLEQNYETVNALNVFPVPDGDTGTNMMLTMRSAFGEIVNSSEKHAGRVAQMAYNGALMGARGNSGVILSQLFRGFARGIEKHASFSADVLVNGFKEASRMAYQAVQEPVEGTMLTVAREAAEACEAAAESTTNLVEILSHIVEAAHDSVRRTPQLLPVLAEAGVVDSGGMGLAVILEGMLRYLHGEPLEVSEGAAASALRSMLEPADQLGYGYDVQFLLKGQGMDVAQVRADIEAMGDSTLVVGDENLIKVHVHVHNPAVPLGYGAERGVLLDVVVENMQEQYQEFLTERGGPRHAADDVHSLAPAIEAGTIATVTVAPGEGLARIFYSLGAGRVIEGGQTMNPSTKDFLEAIEALPTDQVVVLPNNKNIFMSAEQAAQQANGKQVRVVATRTIPQGIAALLALTPHGEFDATVSSMEDAFSLVETGEITTATRTARIDGVDVKEGQVIGLHNDKLTVAGDDVPSVMFELLDGMGADDLELITLYYGADVQAEDAEALSEQVQAAYPDHEIELRVGGQAHYYYIISAE